MLYDAKGFGLAPGPTDDEIAAPPWMHFGVGLDDRDAVRKLRHRLAADGVELVEEWDEPDYVSVKWRDPDGYIVEAFWEPARWAALAKVPVVQDRWRSGRLDGGVTEVRRAVLVRA